MLDRRLVIVGGGIAGLAAAERAVALRPDVEVLVLEAADRPGGMLQTERTEGLVIDRGPDSILSDQPTVMELAARVGLGDAVIGTDNRFRGAYVVQRGKLVRIPGGFTVVGTSDRLKLAFSPILSPLGKLRAACEPLIPRAHLQDESIRAFVTRRYGRELFERLAQPMAGGIYGGDPDRLSAHATLSRFVEHERKYGSVTRGLRSRTRASESETATGARYGLFISFKNGMGALPEAIAHELGSRVRLGTPVARISPEGEGWGVELASGAKERASHVILALPARISTHLVRGFDAALAEELAAIEYGSAATATFAWKRAEVPHPLDAFGFVVPETEHRDALAATWSSVKWPGRAPEDQVLIRVFLARQELLESDDDTLVSAARRELAALMGIEAEPFLTRVDRFTNAMPRYHLGHIPRVDRIERAVSAHTGLALAGNAYRGVGIPDTIRYAQRAAESLLSS